MSDFYIGFQDWLDEMAAVDQPDSDWGYSHSGEWRGKPTRNMWTKRGQKGVPAFTTGAELYDPHRPHPDYEKAAYVMNKPEPKPQDDPVPITATPTAKTPTPKPQPSGGVGEWILATANTDEILPDHNGDDHKIKKGQHVVLKNNNNEKKTWTYATVWKGKLQWHNAHIHAADLKNKFASVKGQDGKPVRGEKASVLAASTYAKEDQDFVPTDEQQDIADTFKNGNDHMMISARAGTGKTTTLKELAKKYSGNQKWLYLVFNKKNQTEAEAAFPRKVQVRTSNAFGGDVIKANKKVIPTNQKRMITVGGTGSEPRLETMQAWNNSYDEMLKNDLHMGGSSKAKYWDLGEKAQKYSNRIKKAFNKLVRDVVSKAKSYGTSPKEKRNDEYDIETILQQHLFDTNLQKIKDAIADDEEDKEEVNSDLSAFYGVDDFLSHDFEDRVGQAAEWMLSASAPGQHSEKFKQPSYTGEELREMFGDKAPNKSRLGDKQRLPSWRTDVKRLFKNSGKEETQHSTKDFRDFGDDVWYLSQHADELKWPKYDVVLVDEVQDFNRGQRIMLKHLMQSGARIIAVGDEKQGIYRFNGADHESFGDVGKMLKDGSKNPENVEKTLTKNWRSKPGIIDHSNKQSIVSDLQAGIPHDEHDEAHISDREHKMDETINRLKTENDSLGELKKDTAFISRNNAPLIKAAMQLMKSGIPFQVQGINLAKDTKDMILDISEHGNLEKDDSVEQFAESLKKFETYKREEIESAGKKGKNVGVYLKELQDNTEAIQAAVDLYIENGGGTVKDFGGFIDKRLGGGDEGITLTTAHKAKGLEFERVYDIAPSLYGANAKIQQAAELSQAADEHLESFQRSHDLESLSDEEEADLAKLEKKARNFRIRYEGDASQEDHAHYVTGTRPMHEFHIVDDTEDEEEN